MSIMYTSSSRNQARSLTFSASASIRNGLPTRDGSTAIPRTRAITATASFVDVGEFAGAAVLGTGVAVGARAIDVASRRLRIDIGLYLQSIAPGFVTLARKAI